MWACARGHTETAVMLYRWNHTALNIKNISNQSAIECAKANNNTELAKELEDLETRRDKANMLLQGNNIVNDNVGSSPTAISPASSVTSLASVASSSKSHDGVFLRPGAVTRCVFNLKFQLNRDKTSFLKLSIILMALFKEKKVQSSIIAHMHTQYIRL